MSLHFAHSIRVRGVDDLVAALGLAGPRELARHALSSADDEMDHTGLRSVLDVLHDRLHTVLEGKLIAGPDENHLFDLSKLINNYILKNLAAELWHPDRKPIRQDLSYQAQVAKFQWLRPRHLGMKCGHQAAILSMQAVAAAYFKKMEQAESPNLMHKYLSSGFLCISYGFNLSFLGKKKKAE